MPTATDFDRDGEMDVLVDGSEPETVSWYENGGDENCS